MAAKNQSGDLRKSLKQGFEEANPRRNKLTREEKTKLSKLGVIVVTLKVWRKTCKTVSCRFWLSADECPQIATEWDTQKIFRELLKDQPSSLKRCED